MTRPTTDPERSPEPLLTVRAAVILTLAMAVGAVTGALTLWAGMPIPTAILPAGAAVGGTIRLLNEMIAHR
jgi:hypothetical protein